jgi:hypothetical protein
MVEPGTLAPRILAVANADGPNIPSSWEYGTSIPQNTILITLNNQRPDFYLQEDSIRNEFSKYGIIAADGIEVLERRGGSPDELAAARKNAVKEVKAEHAAKLKAALAAQGSNPATTSASAVAAKKKKHAAALKAAVEAKEAEHGEYQEKEKAYWQHMSFEQDGYCALVTFTNPLNPTDMDLLYANDTYSVKAHPDPGDMALLDPNHSHFVLVDKQLDDVGSTSSVTTARTYTSHTWGEEITFRTTWEQYVATVRRSHTRHCMPHTLILGCFMHADGRWWVCQQMPKHRERNTRKIRLVNIC